LNEVMEPPAVIERFLNCRYGICQLIPKSQVTVKITVSSELAV